MKRISFLFCLLALAMVSQGQTLYADGATLYVANGGVLWVNGGAEVASGATFTNQGQFTVTKNSTFPAPGNFTLNSTAAVNGDGGYHVEQDWVNNATFTAGNSTVELYGNTAQTITSTNGTVTTFHNLELTGTGTGNDRRKILQNVDARVDVTGFLRINDRELATETWTFAVLNPLPGSVSNDVTPGAEGFVSSLTGGYFSRATNANASYLFPTGSSSGTLRYRPLDITPATATVNGYSARLNNYDPAVVDGYAALADDVCSVNNLYYHSLVRPVGTSAADVRFNYLPAVDGDWNHTAHWQTAGAGWTDMGAVTAGGNGAFATLSKTAWNFPDVDHPYVLSTVRPLPPVIHCPLLCAGSTGNIFTATGSSTGYQWTVPAGAVLESGQGTGNVSVTWGGATGTISVVALGPAGCNSLPEDCQPEVKATPTASFSTFSENQYSPQYLFTDESTLGYHWAWNFGDGGMTSQQSPIHIYAAPGTYEVVLTVTSKEGCTDEASAFITVESNEVFIPNAFTPNADHTNEGFRPVNRSGENVTFYIFDRWGELIYSSSDVSSVWDGTYGGKPCPQDVYICKVEWRDPVGAKKRAVGHVTLLK